MTRASKSGPWVDLRECSLLVTPAREPLTHSVSRDCWKRFRRSQRRTAARDLFRQSQSPAARAKSLASQLGNATDRLHLRRVDWQALVTTRSSFRTDTTERLPSCHQRSRIKLVIALWRCWTRENSCEP